MPDLSLENQLRAAGYRAVCGVDEAGRGPLCGPVVAAACILPPDIDLPGLNDSKKLTPRSTAAVPPCARRFRSPCVWRCRTAGTADPAPCTGGPA